MQKLFWRELSIVGNMYKILNDKKGVCTQKCLRAQAGTEFLAMFTLVLILFTISVAIYFIYYDESRSVADHTQAISLCFQVASSLNSFVSLEGNSTFKFNLPNYLNYKNYSIWIVGNSKLVKINYESKGVGCSLLAANITNSSGSAFFELSKTATVRNYNGVLIIDP